MMDEPEEVHYVATIERSGEPDTPFAAVIKLDGKEVARKLLKTKQEAEIFLQTLQAILERRIAQVDELKLN
jgi:hypothetical protein